MHYATKPPVGTPLNKAHRLNHGLMGYWPFWEGAGIGARDISGNNNHGTLTNFPTNPWTGGKYGRALRFDAVDDNVRQDAYSKSLDLLGTSLTLTAWVKPDNFADYQILITKPRFDTSNTAPYHEYAMFIGVTGGALGLWLAPDSAQRLSLTALVAGVWSHVGITYDSAGAIKHYINGRHDNTITITAVAVVNTNSTRARIGSNGAGTEVMRGLMEEARVYNRPLQAPEMAQLAADPFCMYETESKFRWFVPGVATPAAGPPVGSLALLGVGR